MTLNQCKTLLVGVLKGWFINKKVLDGFDEINNELYFNGQKVNGAGRDGIDGANGTNGVDGFSPTISTSKENGVLTLSITDKNGTRTETISDGINGTNGADGVNGLPGADGFTPTITTEEIEGGYKLTITNKTGSNSIDILNGHDGESGQGGSGATGQDGFSPTVTITEISGGHHIVITDANGEHPFDVLDGTNGINGTNGANGTTPTIEIGTVTTVEYNQSATVSAETTETGIRLNFSIPRGQQGASGSGSGEGSSGADGFSPTIVAEEITGGGGYNITITDVNGSNTIQLLNGTNGIDGTDGQDGSTPTIEVGTVTTVASDQNAEVTSETTATGYKFNFKIPRGETGAAGSGSSGTIPTKTSDLTNDSGFITSTEADTKISNATSNFITGTQADTKISNATSNFITSAQVDAKIANANIGAGRKIVSTLPNAPEEGKENWMYLVENTNKRAKNNYTEYFFINTGTDENPVWEPEEYGKTYVEIDLTGYVKLSDLIQGNNVTISTDPNTGKTTISATDTVQFTAQEVTALKALVANGSFTDNRIASNITSISVDETTENIVVDYDVD